MTSSDHILDQIDSALRDLTVSGDAMRSQPGASRAEAGEAEWQGFATGGLVIDEVTIVVDASEAFIRLGQLRETLAAWGEAVRPRLQEIARTFDQIGETARETAADDCSHKPAPRRDRPAWQTPYGPAQRRR